MAEPDHRGQYKCELIRLFAPDAETNSTKVSLDYYVRVKGECNVVKL